MNNYVKFMRGTPEAYVSLKVKDNNTLYFISETDALTGKLYLGAKEIICDNNVNLKIDDGYEKVEIQSNIKLNSIDTVSS